MQHSAKEEELFEGQGHNCALNLGERNAKEVVKTL